MNKKIDLCDLWDKCQQGAEIERQKRKEEATEKWQKEHDKLIKHQEKMNSWMDRIDTALKQKKEKAKEEELQQSMEESRQELDSKLSKKHLLSSEKEKIKKNEMKQMLKGLFK